MMDFREFLNRCAHIEYVRHAGTRRFGEPMNCYGFVYWFYRLCMGIELESTEVHSFSDIHCVHYERTERPLNGDVVDIRSSDGLYTPHVGIYMNGYIYHFGEIGVNAKKVERIPHLIKGYYHVTENKKRDI